MEEDGRIVLAIENAVAASRWRMAARFEGPEAAARFRRLAAHRSAAATALLNQVARAGRGDNPTGPRCPRDGMGEGGSRRA